MDAGPAHPGLGSPVVLASEGETQSEQCGQSRPPGGLFETKHKNTKIGVF